MSVFFCLNANAETLNIKLEILSFGEKYKILATDGSVGIMQLDFGNGGYCLGTFKLDESYGNVNENGHINIYFPSFGQEKYQGNCHNFSLSIDLQNKAPWNLEIGKEIETTYRGVRSFSAARKAIIKRLE